MFSRKKNTNRDFAGLASSRLARNVVQWLPDHRSTSMTQQHLYAKRASIHLVQEDAGRQGLIVACSPLRAFLSGVVQHALMREQLPATPRRRDCLCASYRCSAAQAASTLASWLALYDTTHQTRIFPAKACFINMSCQLFQVVLF